MNNLKDTDIIEMVKNAKYGNNAIKEELIKQFDNYIKKEISLYDLNEFDKELLYSTGIIGLLIAIERYDINSEKNFVHYAKIIIHRTIYRAYFKEIRPLNKYEGLKDYDYLKLIRHCSEVSNGKRLISLLSVDDEELNDIIISSSVLNIDEYKNSIFEEDNLSDTLYKKDIVDVIDELFDERKADIIKLRFGLIDGVIWKLSDIAKKYSITYSRVGQIIDVAINKLRRKLYYSDKCENDDFSLDVVKQIEMDCASAEKRNFTSLYDIFYQFDKEEIDYVINSNLLLKDNYILKNINKIKSINLKEYSQLYHHIVEVEKNLIINYLSKYSDKCIIFNERNIHIAMDYITSHFKDFINRDGFDISLLENKHLVELSKQIFDFKNEYNKQRTSKKTKRS